MSQLTAFKSINYLSEKWISAGCFRAHFFVRIRPSLIGKATFVLEPNKETPFSQRPGAHFILWFVMTKEVGRLRQSTTWFVIASPVAGRGHPVRWIATSLRSSR